MSQNTISFDYKRIAEGYAKDRPYLHGHVMEMLQKDLMMFDRFLNGLDVGCGAGLSTRALHQICDQVTGVDISTEMIRAAEAYYRDPGYHFVQSRAEEIAELPDTYDIVTAAGVINWIEETAFLRGLSNVMKQDGILLIYDFWITDQMKGVSTYTDWWKEQYEKQFPRPPRKEKVWQQEEVAPYGFEMIKQVSYSMEYKMDLESFERFMLLQSNVMAQVEEKGKKIEEVQKWFRETLQPVFGDHQQTLLFQGYSWYLRLRKKKDRQGIVVAMDSFKGSLTSLQAGNAVKEGILRVDPMAKVTVLPIADGGEGTTEALAEGLLGEYVTLKVTGPLGDQVNARYAVLPDRLTAVMEMAEAAGLVLTKTRRDVLHATTYGVGEMIRDAVLRGCRKILIGIGGSATNDAGIGMLKALGYSFTDEEGNQVPMGAIGLKKIRHIEDKDVLKELSECNIFTACDVTNPLFGEFGATHVFGPQKGLKEEDAESLDKDVESFAGVVSGYLGKDVSQIPGTGAAGGLGFALHAFCNAALLPGIDLILDTVGMKEQVKNAKIVITGEGRIDGQTAMGKGPMGIARLSKKQGALVIGLAGSIGKGARECHKEGMDACFPILQKPGSLEEAMDCSQAAANLSDTAEEVFRLLKAGTEYFNM